MTDVTIEGFRFHKTGPGRWVMYDFDGKPRRVGGFRHMVFCALGRLPTTAEIPA